MLKGLIYLPWWVRKMMVHGPKIYDVHCPRCGWQKTIEIGKVDNDSICIHGNKPAMENRESLPCNCPECGGKLKKEKINIFPQF